MLQFYRYLRGYVKVRVSGYALQRFMNLCSVRGIALNAVQIFEGYALMEMSLSDFWKIRPIVRKTKMKVVLLERKGLPFSVKKWKKRKGFLAGIALCAALLYALSLFIWDIELVPEGRLTREMVLSFLQDEGIGYGTYRKAIDIDSVEKKLRDEFPYIVWTSLQIEGTKLTIAVKENAQPQQAEKELQKQPCDLYSTVQGNVSSIVTRNGIPQVVAGQEVQKGDKLVSGQIPIMNDDDTVRHYMYTHADADIVLDTTFYYEKELPYVHKEKVYTGRQKTVYYIRLYNKSFSLGTMKGMETYDIVTDLKQAKLFQDFYLPFYYGKIKVNEYELQDFCYTKDELQTVLSDGFSDFCESLLQKGIQIIEKDVTIKKNKKSQKIKAAVTVRVRDGEEKTITVMPEDEPVQEQVQEWQE